MKVTIASDQHDAAQQLDLILDAFRRTARESSTKWALVADTNADSLTLTMTSNMPQADVVATPADAAADTDSEDV